mmetsp:Transcript_20416/g.51707  ORF Transcript_20416/g.51707 Transcript_20416/m.51707 type:complete len:421 (-) Transcript_20416:461-1723(-)
MPSYGIPKGQRRVWLPVMSTSVCVCVLNLAARRYKLVAPRVGVARIALGERVLKPMLVHGLRPVLQRRGGKQVGEAVRVHDGLGCHAVQLLEAPPHPRQPVLANLAVLDVAAVVQQQLRVRHALRRVLRRHILEHKLVGEAHNLVLLRGGQQDGVEAAVLPVVLQARLVVDQLQLAVLVDEDVLRVPVALRGEQVKDGAAHHLRLVQLVVQHVQHLGRRQAHRLALVQEVLQRHALDELHPQAVPAYVVAQLGDDRVHALHPHLWYDVAQAAVLADLLQRQQQLHVLEHRHGRAGGHLAGLAFGDGHAVQLDHRVARGRPGCGGLEQPRRRGALLVDVRAPKEARLRVHVRELGVAAVAVGAVGQRLLGHAVGVCGQEHAGAQGGCAVGVLLHRLHHLGACCQLARHARLAQLPDGAQGP